MQSKRGPLCYQRAKTSTCGGNAPEGADATPAPRTEQQVTPWMVCSGMHQATSVAVFVDTSSARRDVRFPSLKKGEETRRLYTTANCGTTTNRSGSGISLSTWLWRRTKPLAARWQCAISHSMAASEFR